MGHEGSVTYRRVGGTEFETTEDTTLTTVRHLTKMKPLAPEYPASSADGLRAAADPKFTMAPRFLATMPGRARRVIHTVELTFISSSAFI